MKNESKNSDVVKLSKRDVFYILLSFLLWGVWIAKVGLSNGIGYAIGILGQGSMLLLSGITIGSYKERREASKRKQDEDEAENQQDAVEQVKCY